MKLSGAHVVVLMVVAVAGLLVYGGVRLNQPATPAVADDEEFLEEIRKTADTVPSTEEGLVQPLAKADDVPVIELEPAGDIDFGVVKNDGPTVMEIKVHNKGKAPLKITRIHNQCGCSRAQMEEKDKTIAPGKFSPLTITVNPAAIAGLESHKNVTITSNDPATPNFQFAVLAKIEPEYLLEPAEVNFGAVEKGQAHEKTVLLRQLKDEPIEITRATSMVRNGVLDVSYALRPQEQWLDAGKREYDITFRLAEHVPLGPFSGRVTILTTCKRRKEIYVIASATVTSWYTITPARMLILRQVPGAGQEGPAQAVIAADRPFEVVDIAPTVEGLKATVTPGDKENTQVIHLELEPSARPRGKIEYVHFGLKSGDQTVKEVLEVRVIPGAKKPANPDGAPSAPVAPPAPTPSTPSIPIPPATETPPTEPAAN